MICENEEEAIAEFGIVIAKKLKSRLSDLLAAKNVTDIFTGSPAEITYQSITSYKIDLPNDYRLVFCPNHRDPLLLPAGGIDWNNVRRIKILAIDNDDE